MKTALPIEVDPKIMSEVTVFASTRVQVGTLFDYPNPARSRHEYCGAFESAGAEIGKGLVGLVERIGRGLGDDADLRYHAQEIDSILSREIGNRDELPLFP